MKAPRTAGDFCAAAAVNSIDILNSCLLRSPDIASGVLPLKTYEGYRTAASALNAGLDESSAPIIIFVHQDVYLPKSWLTRLAEQIDLVEQTSPDWSVMGMLGRKVTGEIAGRVWSSGIGREIGRPNVPLPAEVVTLDELVLILRRDSGLRFDEGLPGFHLYGADIICQGRTRQMPAFAIDAPVIHHDKPVGPLHGSYATAYKYMQRKWWDSLPVKNLICDITRSPVPLWRAQIRRYRALWRTGVERPSFDAVALAKSLNYENT